MVAAVAGLCPAAAQERLQLPAAAKPDVRLEQVVPPTPQDPPRLVVPQSAPTRAPAGADQIQFVLQEVEVEGATAYDPDYLRSVYEDQLGTQISLSNVYELADALQRIYRADGYFLARVIVPTQEIRDGRVRLQVLEGYISDVQIEGDVGPVAEKVRAYLEHVVDRRPLDIATLERYLLLANDLPGLQVLGVLRPSSDKPGAAQLVASVERDRFEGLVMFDNFGSSFTGEFEAFGSAAANSFTSQGEQVRMSGLISEPSDAFHENQRVIQLSATLHPGADGWYAQSLVSYGNSTPTGIIRQFDFDSTTLLVRAAGGYPIIRSRNRNLIAEVGFDFINSDTDIFNDLKFSRDRLRVLYASAKADMRDAWRGATSATVQVRQGLPIFDASRSGDEFLSRSDGTGVFTSIGASVSRLQSLYGDFSLYGIVAGQFAFNPLLADEEFDLGGTLFGRGYDPGEISGDHGIGFSGELRYTRQLGFDELDRIQVFAFYDVGQVWQKDQDFSESLASAGGGLRVWPKPWFAVELLAAKPLTRDSQRADDGGRRPQVLFRVSGQF